jgi:hypothetical protein
MSCHRNKLKSVEVCRLNLDVSHPDSLAEYDFEMAGSHGLYSLSWPQLNITARVDRIKESTDHEVKGEVQLTSTRPTSAGHLRAGRLNITSPSARNTFGKSLAARDAGVDWDKVLEQLCMAVLREWRQGSPVVQLDGQVDVRAQAKWLIEPLIQLNNPTLIYGPGSTGKSWFGQYLATLADEGMRHGDLSVEPSSVLYLDWETDQIELGTRITLLRRGLGLEGASHIWYKAMTQGLSNDIEAIRSVCAEKMITLVIVDSLGSACMGEPESAEVVLRTFTSLRTLGISSLLIDHTNKENNMSGQHAQNLFGSVYKYNAARMVFQTVKDQAPEEDKLVFGLFHKKANNSRLMRPIGFEFSFSDEAVSVMRRDVRDTPLEEHMRVIDRIQNVLKNKPGGLSVTDIAEALEKTESHIRKELSEGKQRGRFVVLEGGKYANRAWEEEEAWKL